jgi:hypothetical protein
MSADHPPSAPPAALAGAPPNVTGNAAGAL